MKNVTFIRNEFHLLYVLKSKNFAIRLKKKQILKFIRNIVYLIEIYDINIYIYPYTGFSPTRLIEEKKEREFRLPVKLLSRSFCHSFVSLPPLSRSDAFSFLTLKTCQDEGKSGVAVGGGARGLSEKALVGKRRETRRPWHWCGGRMANTGIVKGNFWAGVSCLFQAIEDWKKKRKKKNVRKRRGKFYISIIHFFFFNRGVKIWKRYFTFISFDDL